MRIVSKEALDEMTKWAVLGDQSELKHVMARTRSIGLTGGLRVKVLDTGGILYSEKKVRVVANAEGRGNLPCRSAHRPRVLDGERSADSLVLTKIECPTWRSQDQMQCPNCKLENPAGAPRCDCGYAFSLTEGETRRCPYCAETIQAAAI